MNIWNIAAKDLLLLVRDRRAVVVLVALPLVFIAIIGMSTGRMLGWRNQNETLRIAVVNNSALQSEASDQQAPDSGTPSDQNAADEDEEPLKDLALSRLTLDELAPEIIKRLKQHKGISTYPAATLEAARALIEDENYTAAIVIGPEFTARVDELKDADVFDENSGFSSDLSGVDILIETPEPMTNAGALARLLVHSEVYRVVGAYVSKKDEKRAKQYEHSVRVRRIAREGKNKSEQLQDDEPEVSGGFGSVVYQKVVPAYTVMFAFFLVTLMSRSFLTEHELGTYRRLKTTPVSSTSMILGKVLPYFLISLVQSALLFAFGKLLFGMSWGVKPWLLFPVVVATSAAATALGTMIATIVRTEAQVTSIATLVILAMAGISGCFTPRDWLPDAMRTLSLGTPHAWALIAYDQILNSHHPDVPQVWQCCGWLWAFAVVYFAIGWWRFQSLPA